MTRTEGTFTIQREAGPDKVTGYTYGPIGVHGDYDTGYSVTHIPTGKRIRCLRAFRFAEAIAKRLTRSAEGRAICAKSELSPADLQWIGQRTF